jgi:hypothetical protein
LAGRSPTCSLRPACRRHGTSDTYDGGVIGVPKLSLVSRVQALLHEGRLKIHKDLAEAAELVRELQDFRVEFTAAGSITFNARSGRHDDLVLTLAIATWRAYGSGPGMNMFRLYRQQGGEPREGGYNEDWLSIGRRGSTFLTPQNQSLASAPRLENRHFSRPIREVGAAARRASCSARSSEPSA